MTAPPPPFVAACVQMNSSAQVEDNLKRADALLATAASREAKLAVLPEFFPHLSADETAKLAIAETDNDGPIQNFLATAAKQYSLYLVGGTIPIRTATADKISSACLLYTPDGQRLARYDKIHLFRYHGNNDSYDETTTMQAGDKVVCVDTPLGKIGLAVCYDLRFPELFRQMNRADILAIPSAFVPETGRAHWETLLRARAIENLATVFAAAQAGEHPGGRKTYGDSMIIGAWGDIQARATTTGDECIFATVEPAKQQALRERLPALDNRCL